MLLSASEDRDIGEKLRSHTVSMVSQVEKNAQPRPQVLLVGAKDSTRLLEVYVKRSLSLNDGSHCPPRTEQRTHKFVTAEERDKRERKHSSDISLHFKPSSSEEDLDEDEEFSEPETDRKAQEENETTARSKLWKKKSTLSRNDGSSASCTSDGKTQNGFAHFDKDKHGGRQPNIPSLHPKPSASKEDLTEDKAFSEPITESETSDKHKQWKKSSLTRKDCSSASQSSDGKPRKQLVPFDKDKQDSILSHETFEPESEDLKIKDSSLPPQPQLEILTEVKKVKEGKKIKKPSIWKSVLGWFSRGNTDKQDEQDDGRTEEAPPTPEPTTLPLTCLPISTGDGIILRHAKTSRRRRSPRMLSLKRRSGDMGVDKTTVRPLTLDLSTEVHNSQVQAIKVVEATTSYYEKMSEELEKIVNEVKNSPTEENKTFIDSIQPDARSQEEIIKRIIDLLKQEGDVINDKLKENATISAYINTITYGSFQQLADQYVNFEVPQVTTQPSTVAPELVKFAFTLDFTARVAALSRHAPGHILGFGNQYLKERFTYTCENHPHISDITTDKHVTLKESSDRDQGLETMQKVKYHNPASEPEPRT